MPIYQNGELKWPRPCFKDGAIKDGSGVVEGQIVTE